MSPNREFHLLIALVVILTAMQICSFRETVDNLHNALYTWENRLPLGLPDAPVKPGPGDTVPGGSQAEPDDLSPTPGMGLPVATKETSSGLKPVCFLNTGTTAATIAAWTYMPAGSTVLETPSRASTVAFPGGNPSACLSLPPGTYTWCYHWELGDTNDDGYIEYAYAVDSRPVYLDVSATEDLDLTLKVDIAAPPGFNEHPGTCPLQGDVIAWGNQSSEWRVELDGGRVVGGSAGGTNYYSWMIQSGTFDGETLYFQATTADVQGCKAQIEAWWTVTSSTVASIRVRDGCGTESTEVHSFTRIE